jgi:hypothetical protein
MSDEFAFENVSPTELRHRAIDIRATDPKSSEALIGAANEIASLARQVIATRATVDQLHHELDQLRQLAAAPPKADNFETVERQYPGRERGEEIP